MPSATRDTAEGLWREAAAAFQRGDLDAAESLSRAVIARDPRHAAALHGLGLIESRRGRTAEATSLLRESIDVDPTNPSAHFNLGLILVNGDDPAAATASHRRAIALHADYADAWSALSASLAAQGDFAAAADAARHALALSPGLVAARVNLSIALDRGGDEAAALETILECVQSNPDSAEAWFWMGQTLHLRGEITAAIPAYDRAIALDPDHVLAHARRGTALLATGDFAIGWPEYEWRLRGPGANTQRLSQPRWAGESLSGKRILLAAEQGLGDAIQMLRYVESLAENAVEVLVEVDPAVAPLVPRRSNVRTITRGGALPAFDVHSPLLSLPLASRTTLDNLPGRWPYVRADPTRVHTWAEVLAAATPSRRRRIGLAWAGNRRHQLDRERSLSFATLAPLFAQSDIAWVSLQVGDRSADAIDSPVVQFPLPLSDFGETAAAMMNLDLVITVDTAVAHVAGALGVPVWILLAHLPDWRWLLEREDSPWYPSARLFRQRTRGDWGGVIERVASALAGSVH